MTNKKIVRITKGKDSFLKVTPLSEYCLQRGWKIVKEYVEIVPPRNKELKEFEKDVREGKIVVLPEGKKED